MTQIAIVVGGTPDTLNVGTILTHVGPYSQAIGKLAHTSTDEVLAIIANHKGDEVTVFICDQGEAGEDLYRDLQADAVTVHLFRSVEDIYKLLGKS